MRPARGAATVADPRAGPGHRLADRALACRPRRRAHRDPPGQGRGPGQTDGRRGLDRASGASGPSSRRPGSRHRRRPSDARLHRRKLPGGDGGQLALPGPGAARRDRRRSGEGPDGGGHPVPAGPAQGADVSVALRPVRLPAAADPCALGTRAFLAGAHHVRVERPAAHGLRRPADGPAGARLGAGRHPSSAAAVPVDRAAAHSRGSLQLGRSRFPARPPSGRTSRSSPSRTPRASGRRSPTSRPRRSAARPAVRSRSCARASSSRKGSTPTRGAS